ncbi:hypothetical protein QR77_37770 [Streptomyces sp. 150FB]|nr:hypothetical protein QR77_37770 [Streptomyces sp. 150FB]
MSSADQPESQVMVALNGNSRADAHAVFGALRTAFATDRPADDLPEDVPGDRPTVWTATFDVSDVQAQPEPTRLTAPVTASLHGGYAAVDHLRRTLAAAFTVRVVGTAAGDQEEEVQLRLENR